MNWKKIYLYILLSFGISWLVALGMKLADVEYGTITSMVILGFLYMPGPALATWIIQKFIYKERFKTYGWTFDVKRLKWLLYTVLIFISLILLTFLVIALLGNTHVMPQFGEISFSQQSLNNNFRELLIRTHISLENLEVPTLPPLPLFALLAVQGIVAGATINLPFMFGEELGWRGLLLRETQKFGFSKANLFIGVVWGLWHLPVILMGHNYPHHPYFGIVMMCLLTTALTPLFAYVRLKTKSILGACMLHGMINTTPTIFALYITNANELYSSLAGAAGIIACALLTTCIYLFDKPFVTNYPTAE